MSMPDTVSMKYFFICFSILMFCFRMEAQKTISGKVFDSQTKEPIVGVVITDCCRLIVDGNTKSLTTVTDDNGNFTLQTTDEKVTVTSLGFQTTEIIGSENMRIALIPSEENLQSVIITANRVASARTTSPIAVSKLSTKLIDETKSTSLYEVLNKTPGVLVTNQGNEQTQMSIRQPMSLNALFLYLEDGLPIRPPGIFQANALIEINQLALSAIEIVHGPASSLYGAEAVGGAINFISQRPTVVPTGKIGIQFDQFGYARLQYGGGATVGKFGFYVGGLISRQRNSWLSNSDYDKQAQFARAEYTFSEKTKLIGTVTYVDYNSSTSGSIDSTAFYARQYMSTTDFTYRKSFALRTRFTLEQKWNDNAQSFVTAFFRNNNISQNPAYAISWVTGATTANGQINSNSFKSLGLVAQHTINFKPLALRHEPSRDSSKLRANGSKLIIGASIDESPNDYNAYRLELAAQLRTDKKSVEKYSILRERPDIKLSDYNAQIHNEAVYAQLTFSFEPLATNSDHRSRNAVDSSKLKAHSSWLKSLSMSLGARYDRMAFDYLNNLDTSTGLKTFDHFSPKIGLTYEIVPNVGVYANFANGFSPPALSAIFLKRTIPTASGDKYYFNLEPATFINSEIGGWAALANNKIYIDFAIYQLNGANELLNIRQPDNSFDFQSVGKTSHKGVELSVTFKPTPEYFFRFGGTYAIHKFIDFTLSTKTTDSVKNVNGNEMPSAPHFVWNTEFNYYPKGIKNFRAAIEWQHVAGWYQNQINTVSYEGYDVFNARFGYKWHNLDIFTNILNLSDALYATQATRGNNATDRSNYYASAPRTFMFGAQYNF